MYNKSMIALAVSATLINAPLLAEEIATTKDNEQLEIITVTSDFRQTNLQKTPASISILSDEEFALRNAQNLEEIAAAIPNINFSSGSQRARYYQIRGIGERSQFREPINPSVGVIIDDIDFTGMGSIASTFDIAQTEVFRGPQGTRFGSNALAGLINITTNKPSDSFEGEVNLQAGNYDSMGYGLVISGPASDKASYRLVAEKYQSDGFIQNTHLNREDTNNRDEVSLRGKLSAELSSDLTLDLAVLHFDFDNGYDAFSLDNNRKTMSDQPGFDRHKITGTSAKFTYTGYDKAEVTTIITHADFDLAYGYDEDWSFVGLHPWEYSSTDHYLRDKQLTTAEIRFVSTPESLLFNNSTLWTTGLYLKQDDENLRRQYTYLGQDFVSDFETKTIAWYGQLDTQINNQLTLTTGLRVENRQADYNDNNLFNYDPDETMLGGKFIASYQLDSERFIYGSINRGYKAGGVNANGTIKQELREFEAEYLWNYEIGYKASILNGDAFIRTAFFYMDRKDVQVRSAYCELREDNSCEFISYLGNAAAGNNRGVEIESAWYLSDQLELNINLGLLDTEFTEFTNASGEELTGRDQAYAPNYQYYIGLTYQINDALLFNASVEGKDNFYFSDSHSEKSNSVNLANASLTYSADSWQVRLWGRNLLDKEYQTRGFYFGNDPRDGYTAKQYTQLAEPRVFGINFDYDF